MALIEINKETCTKCGICANMCGMIHFKEGSYPVQIPGTDEFCMRCGHCIGICPNGSITHKEMPPEQCPLIEESLAVSFEQCAQLIRSRRSIREYQDKLVPREEIERIIDVARFSPTGHNMQEVWWMVIDDREELRNLTAIGVDWFRSMAEGDTPWAMEMQMILKAHEMGINVFLRDAPALVIAFTEKDIPIAATDCAIALSYFDLAATTAGLGCCWNGFFSFSAQTFPAMIEAVAMPEGFTPYVALMLGYPKYKYQRIPVRKDARIIYHQ